MKLKIKLLRLLFLVSFISNNIFSKTSSISNYFSQASEYIKTKSGSLSSSMKNIYKSKSMENIESKTYNNLSEINILENFAQVEISTWNNKNTEIKIIKSGKQEVLEKIKQELKVKDNHLIIKSPDLINKNKQEFSVKYKILAPETLAININIKKGNVKIENSKGIININIENGNLNIEGGNNSITARIQKGNIIIDRDDQEVHSEINLWIKKQGNINFYLPQDINSIFHLEVIKNGSIKSELKTLLFPIAMDKINKKNVSRLNKNLKFMISDSDDEEDIKSKIVAVTNFGSINILNGNE